MQSDDQWNSVRSLLSLSVDAVTTCLGSNITTLKILPPHLKNILLSFATKRSIENNVLQSLLHPGVRVLDLSENQVSDDTLGIVSECRYLQKLDINPGRNQSRQISSSALMALMPCLPYLSVLYMRRCPAVTDEVIRTVVSCCPLLKELDVGGCTTISDESLNVLKDLKQLSSLNVSCSQVSDEGILSLVRGTCGNTLTELHLDNCLGVTDFAIQAIVLFCNNMKVLIFHGCPVTDASWQALEELLRKSKVKQLTWTIY
ncbi:protein AMN1 homolog [Anabrus simplex]|uniref:protein AMN1 homolog n=1 Tax=Anabrus simplex TaxID=316456 RepID=UPI0035A311DC